MHNDYYSNKQQKHTIAFLRKLESEIYQTRRDKEEMNVVLCTGSGLSKQTITSQQSPIGSVGGGIKSTGKLGA